MKCYEGDTNLLTTNKQLFKMNIGNFRSKQRQIQRTLQSIPIPRYTQKIVTEVEEPPLQYLRNMLVPYNSKQIKPSRRYSRPKHLSSEQNQLLSKYKSLEIKPRNRKVSHHKLQKESTQFDPYLSRPVKKRNSAQNIQPVPTSSDRHFLKSKRLKKREPTQTKQLARDLMKKGQFNLALALLSQNEELGKNDAEYLELQGVCLLRLQNFEQALEVLTRVILYDRKNCRQAYIWCALCQNQLSHPGKSMRYIDECIRLFPDHDEAYHLKGKISIKQKHYEEALKSFETALRLNSSKAELSMLIAECKQFLRDFEGALASYKQQIEQISSENVGLAGKMCRVLVKMGKQQEAEDLLEQCICLTENSSCPQNEDSLLEASYLLAFSFFKKGIFGQIKKHSNAGEIEKALMKGEWVLGRGKSKWIQPTIRVMMAAKIAQRDFYGALNISERLELLGCLFCSGAILLMRKRALEGLVSLEQCQAKLRNSSQTQLNAPIKNVLHLYLFYAYCLLGRDKDALHQLELQRSIGLSQIYSKSASYNEAITLGFIAYSDKQYQQAFNYFTQAQSLDSRKADAALYQAVTLFEMAQKNQVEQGRLADALNLACSTLEENNGNFAAYAYYYRGLFRAWIGDWSNAVIDLDIAIDKSEDNFSKFFHLRALTWALVQNYQQAISDVSIALSIDPEDSDCYLLRARCLQMEGDPTQAFNDLQSFIEALRPDDRQIHKFAGHLLFENGAFEDALQAYKQGEVNQEDTEVFLTRSKTNFLLGNFFQAAEDMLNAAHSVPNGDAFLFDYQMMKWLGEFQFPLKNIVQGRAQFEPLILRQQLSKIKKIYEDRKLQTRGVGKIFRNPQLFTLCGMILFYLQQYQESLEAFQEAINIKLASFGGESEGEFEEDEAEKKVFINQMFYNIAICFCMMKDYVSAQQALLKCNICKELHTYQTYEELLKQIKGQIQVQLDLEYLDLFSLRNKISRFIPAVSVPFCYQQTHKTTCRKMKICIPYPKVQPPDINPTFDKNLLVTVNLKYLERRPEAPWIFKENNAIKFTEKMQVYSKLSLGQSSVDNIKRPEFGMDSSVQSLDIDIDIKKKLQLDEEVEFKLNKMFRKKAEQ